MRGLFITETIIIKEPSVLTILESFHMLGKGPDSRPPIHLVLISKGPAGGASAHLSIRQCGKLMERFFFDKEKLNFPAFQLSSICAPFT